MWQRGAFCWSRQNFLKCETNICGGSWSILPSSVALFCMSLCLHSSFLTLISHTGALLRTLSMILRCFMRNRGFSALHVLWPYKAPRSCRYMRLLALELAVYWLGCLPGFSRVSKVAAILKFEWLSHLPFIRARAVRFALFRRTRVIEMTAYYIRELFV